MLNGPYKCIIGVFATGKMLGKDPALRFGRKMAPNEIDTERGGKHLSIQLIYINPYIYIF